MKKNNIFYILFFCLLAGCSKKSPELLITRWQDKNPDQKVIERSLASSSNGKSLKSIFTVETLKNQIFEIEKKYKSGEKLQGSWKHLDLSQLPLPQGNFLNEYGNEIGDIKNPHSIDYSSCKDVPCIFNKIYNKENHIAGYVHYLWYLKFGNMLSADNKVPSQVSKEPGSYNGREFPLQSYLFTDNELYGFWRLSLMLKSPYTTLNYLKEIQRIPRGEFFEDTRFKWACGLAHSTGWINLTDECLVMNDSLDTSFLYQGVTHELSHHVDFEEGRSLKISNRSLKQDYLDISGMVLFEYVDASKKVVRNWRLKESGKAVSSYAGTHPSENFADSLAIYRIDGDQAKSSLSPEHYHFISKNYFQNRKFEKVFLMKKWIHDYFLDIEKSVLKASLECTKTNALIPSDYFSSNEFTFFLSPKMINCLGKFSFDFSQDFSSRISLYEPEGSLVFNDFELKKSWNELVHDSLRARIEYHLKEWTIDKNYLYSLQALEKILFNKATGQTAYVNCFNDREMVNCYDKEVLQLLTQSAPHLKLTGIQLDKISKTYQAIYSFEKIKLEIEEDYHQFTSIHHSLIVNKVKRLWSGCKSIAHDDTFPPSGSFFQVHDGYMVSSFYNCLNGNIPLVSKEIVSSLSVDGFKVVNVTEQNLLNSQIIPKIVSTLKEIYILERNKEKKWAEDFMFKNSQLIRSQILENFNWIKSTPVKEYLDISCKERAFALIPLVPLFHLKSDLFDKSITMAFCHNLEGTPQFQQWLVSAKPQFIDELNNQIEKKLVDLSLKRLKACVREYPNSSDSQDKPRLTSKRKSCIVDNWFELEDMAITGMDQNPTAVMFKIPLSSLKSNLLSKREVIQKYMLENFFN